MSRRTVGVVFIAIAAFLYATRFICGTLLLVNLNVINHDMLVSALQSLGSGLTLFSLLSLVIGAFYLMWEEFGDKIAALKAKYDIFEERYSYSQNEVNANSEKKVDSD